jgi:hypothetical protein
MPRTERLRLLLIGSSVLAILATALLGVPRVRGLMTPRIERVFVVSAALGDATAAALPRDVLRGTPVTLFALVEARSWPGGEVHLYGPIPEADLGEGSVAVRPWKTWWYPLEFLWFKVEPLYGFDNESFEPGFAPADLVFTDAYQVAWGFEPRHALDVKPAADVFPDLDVGTMRFAARAIVRDWRTRILQQVESPGAAAVHAPAALGRPHRVSVRAGDDALGRLQAFAGLTYVPFATSEQSTAALADYLGGTVLAHWLRASQQAGAYAGPVVPWSALADVADVVVEEMFLGNDGEYYWTNDPLRTVDWDVVESGDILAIEDHIGILAEDRGPGGGGDGRLNRWDVAWEAYYEPLRTVPLGDAFVSGITVWRLHSGAAGEGGTAR